MTDAWDYDDPPCCRDCGSEETICGYCAEETLRKVSAERDEAREAAGNLLVLAVCLGLPYEEAQKWRERDWLREAERWAAAP
jgi:hypothetical protein